MNPGIKQPRTPEKTSWLHKTGSFVNGLAEGDNAYRAVKGGFRELSARRQQKAALKGTGRSDQLHDAHAG
jgi:hypothetical protein